MLKVNDFYEKKGEYRVIFFAGVGGVSMSALALACKKRGFTVKGYDAVKTHVTEKLAGEGIDVFYTYSDEMFCDVDLFVYTGALKESDPVMQYPKKNGIKIISRAELMGGLMLEKKNRIGISGAHGKSTTTGMLSCIFLNAKRDPTIFVGADLSMIDGTYKLGEGDDFIFEACEYQDSFLSFFPSISIVLNVEHEHVDYFKTLQSVKDSFTRFMQISESANGYAVVNLDDENAASLLKGYTGKYVTFSSKCEEADFFAKNIEMKKGYATFELYVYKESYGSITLSVPGGFNVSNALAAIGAAHLCGVSMHDIKRGVESFGGVKRRFEKRGTVNGITVVDDYAHHPSEINATVRTACDMGYKEIAVVFQSHTYTRTQAYFNEIVNAFSPCKQVIFADIYSARECEIENVNAPALAAAAKNGKYLGGIDDIARYLKASKDFDLVIIMGAGDIIALTDKILDK